MPALAVPGALGVDPVPLVGTLPDRLEPAEAGGAGEPELLHALGDGVPLLPAEGKQVGGVKGAKYNVKKRGPAKERIKKLSNRYGGPLTAEETWRVCGISRGTYYSYCREIDSELAHETAQSEDDLKRTLA